MNHGVSTTSPVTKELFNHDEVDHVQEEFSRIVNDIRRMTSKERRGCAKLNQIPSCNNIAETGAITKADVMIEDEGRVVLEHPTGGVGWVRRRIE